MKLRSANYTTPEENKTKPAQMAALSFILGAAALAVAGTTLIVWNHSRTHLPLQAEIAGIAVGNKTPEQAEQLLRQELATPKVHSLTIFHGETRLASESSTLQAHYPIHQKVRAALGQPELQLSPAALLTNITHYFRPYSTDMQIEYDQQALDELITVFTASVSGKPEAPTATKTGGSVTVTTGKKGIAVKPEETKRQIATAVAAGEFTVPVVTTITGTELSDEQQELYQAEAQKLLGTQLRYTAEGYGGILDDATLISLLAYDGTLQEAATETLLLKWQDALEREPQDPVFEFNKETLEVTKFEPPLTGRALDSDKAAEVLQKKISQLIADEETQAEELQIPVSETQPQKSLADTNELGIVERIGRGDSHYDHSIPNRIHNVAITTERINNVLIPPGEEFSFNKTLGEVSSRTGYKSAYVIRNGRTELGDGGGVCQVSTTLFRAVLDAGLDVTLRLPHSYRVSYYELDRKPGVDATVYSGNVDFRFINDTENYVLVHGAADSDNLYMYLELYGTSDGRTTQIVDHKTWNFRGAPPAQYIDTTELAPGQLRQVDWAAAGISASFTHVIKNADGEVKNETTYTSHYKPWAAKYLRGV